MEPRKRLLRNHILISLISSSLLILIVSAAYLNRGLERTDLFVYDLHFRVRGPQPASGRTALVLMDQRSAAELARKKGAWSRSDVARALRNLTRAGAEIIGLDVVFFAPALEPAEDEALEGAIAECGNVILARFVAVEGRGEVTALARFQEGMLGDGFINMFPDRDGVLRKIPFLSVKSLKEGVEVLPSFSLELVRAFLDIDFVFDFSRPGYFLLGAAGAGQIRLPYPDLRIHYYGREEAFPRISFADAVHNTFDPQAVSGKIVLMGSSLATEKDFFATPFAGYRQKEAYEKKFGQVMEEDFGSKTAGVACHAHAVETVLKGDFIRRVPQSHVVLLVVLCGLLGMGFHAPRPGAFWGLVLLGAGLGLMAALSHLLFVQRLLWVEAAAPASVLALQYVGGIALQRSYSKKKTELVTGLFGKYVSPGVVRDLLKGDLGVGLEGRSKEVTVLFSDLRGFTTLSERLTPLETGRVLNAYFDAMIPIVFEHEGTLDKLMGDAIMCFFGAPGDLADHPVKAAETALEMLERLERLKTDRSEKGVAQLEVGIGLNTGQVTVGNLGSQRFMDYTVIGDAVNLGSRLEGLNKTYGTRIILSETTAQRLSGRFLLRELDCVRVKGKGEPVTILELLGRRDKTAPERAELAAAFEAALAQYKCRAWDRAGEGFAAILKAFPQDGPSRLYLARTEELLRNPPPADWEPVCTFTTK